HRRTSYALFAGEYLGEWRRVGDGGRGGSGDGCGGGDIARDADSAVFAAAASRHLRCARASAFVISRARLSRSIAAGSAGFDACAA
ncbi:hypothetical protein NL533_32885, partial [Klebsiella pneumoniae]|nr:hypothetical protein [Klebsiella pneumoniae]